MFIFFPFASELWWGSDPWVREKREDQVYKDATENSMMTLQTALSSYQLDKAE
jgi:hypothetical protein